MKIAVTGDLHFGDKRHSLFIDNQFVKIQETAELMDRFIEKLQDNKVDFIVLLGDIFDSKILDVQLVSRLIEWLNRLDSLNIPIVIFPGNHESSAMKTSLDFIENISYQNIKYYNVPDSLEFRGHQLLFLPYWNEKIKKIYPTEQEFISTHISDKIPNLAFAHLWLSGAFLNENSNEEWIEKKDLFLNGIDYFVSGHIHKSQSFSIGNTIIHYPGAPLYLDFGDNHKDEKTFSIIDTETGMVDKIEIIKSRKYYTYYLTSISQLTDYQNNDFDYIKFKISKNLKHEIPKEFFDKKNFIFEIVPQEEIDIEEKIKDVSFEEIINKVIKKRNLTPEFEKQIIQNLIRIKEGIC